jgi:hypothetical protein
MTPCSPLRLNQCFGGTYRLHLQGRRNKFSKNQQASRWLDGFCLFLRPWRWRRYVPPKRRLKLDGLHGVMLDDDILQNHRCENLKSYINNLHNYMAHMWNLETASLHHLSKWAHFTFKAKFFLFFNLCTFITMVGFLKNLAIGYRFPDLFPRTQMTVMDGNGNSCASDWTRLLHRQLKYTIMSSPKS